MTARPQDVALLPLPEPVRMSSDQAYLGYTFEQMEAYARANVTAALASAQAREEELRVALTLEKAGAEHERIRMTCRIERLEEALREPTDEMVEAGRNAVMALECSGPKWTVRQHYAAMGEEPKGIPDALLDMHCPMPKACRAEMIYLAMTAALSTNAATQTGETNEAAE